MTLLFYGQILLDVLFQPVWGRYGDRPYKDGQRPFDRRAGYHTRRCRADTVIGPTVIKSLVAGRIRRYGADTACPDEA